MGSVWLAEHQGLGTQVVVKFMMAELRLDAPSVQRFSREAAAAAHVKSPHVVQTLDHGVTSEGVPFIVMELLEGRDLAKHLAAKGALSPEETLAIVEQLCKALDRAHQKGIVHRDIKPENVFLCDVGHDEVFVKLLDFGIAKTQDVLAAGSATKTGALIGTPYYMSPEQSLGSKAIDHRTDLWSVGVVTYECLTGTKPFEGETIAALALALHHGPIPTVTARANWLPVTVDGWFARVCAREMAERPASARLLADGLRQALGVGSRASSADPLVSRGSGSWAGQSNAGLSTSTASASAVSAELPMSSNRPLVLGVLGALVVAGAGFAGVKVLGGSDGAGPPSASAIAASPPAVPAATPSGTPSSKVDPPAPVVAPLASTSAAGQRAEASPSLARPTTTSTTAKAAATAKVVATVAPKTKPAINTKPPATPAVTATVKAVPKPRPLHHDDIQ
jgi:serine/threonine-protein kinase